MNKTHLLLCSHGNFANELLKSAEMIAGKMDDVETFSLIPGMSMQEFREIISNKIGTFGKDSKILCLVDLYGGTPSTTVMSLMQDSQIDVVTGLNLPMLLEVYNSLSSGVEEGLVELAYDTLMSSGYKIKYKDINK